MFAVWFLVCGNLSSQRAYLLSQGLNSSGIHIQKVGALSFLTSVVDWVSFLSSPSPKLFGCLLYLKKMSYQWFHTAVEITGENVACKPNLQLFFHLYCLKYRILISHKTSAELHILHTWGIVELSIRSPAGDSLASTILCSPGKSFQGSEDLLYSRPGTTQNLYSR